MKSYPYLTRYYETYYEIKDRLDSALKDELPQGQFQDRDDSPSSITKKILHNTCPSQP